MNQVDWWRRTAGSASGLANGVMEPAEADRLTVEAVDAGCWPELCCVGTELLTGTDELPPEHPVTRANEAATAAKGATRERKPIRVLPK